MLADVLDDPHTLLSSASRGIVRSPYSIALPVLTVRDSGMHRSKLVAALADVPAEHFEAETAFWTGAFGTAPERDEDNPAYAYFGEVTPGFQFYVQQVDAPARVHLDIETDDVEAEVRRLEALGATRVEQVKSWWIMRDPAGMLFCVVRIQLPETFDSTATTWE